MKKIPVSFSQLADFALQLTARATIQADDDSIALTQAVRQMLRQITTGELEVVQPSKETADVFHLHQ